MRRSANGRRCCRHGLGQRTTRRSIDSSWSRPTSISVGYPRIEDHGIVGDLRTVALVCTDGTVDWFCTPHVDSPSVFGSILDDRKGGHFTIRPTSDTVQRKQLYWP